MNDRELSQLSEAIELIHAKARSMGLDGFPMRYEICPADVLYTFGAYGMPARFSHWSFGKAFHRMKTQYDLNLSRIYELVINSDPCHAFLLDGNTLLQNKVIIAHVLAHSDFFRHNYRFAGTSRRMVDTMAAHADRIRRYEMRYGRDAVEAVLDAALALQEQVDPCAVSRRPSPPPEDHPPSSAQPARRITPYDDLWALDGREDEDKGDAGEGPGGTGATGDPAAPGAAAGCRSERDLLLFLMEHSRVLSDWERDVLAMVRAEMLYFWPQLETKIVNEGWATYWHARIMRELDLSESEALEFARLHAAVLAPSPFHINPYHVGYGILRDLATRRGEDYLFEVRETETDVSLVRNHLTRELVEELDLYVYRRQGDEWVVTSKDWREVRDQLVQQLINGGIPVITVADDDWRGTGQLYLLHRYEGVELDRLYTERTLPYVYRLWGRPVHLETVMDGRRTVFTCEKDHVSRSDA